MIHLVAIQEQPWTLPGGSRGGPGRADVLAILRHAGHHEWTLQETGLLGLRLDDRREFRLHVWDPSRSTGEPPIHDHPFDFTSTVIVGEMTNTRYEEDPTGAEYRRERYRPGDEDDRRVDAVRLVSSSSAHTAGGTYAQLAHELHDSRQLPGTVTVIRRSHVDVPELTVCLRAGDPWVSGRSRPATREEVASMTALALAWC